MGFNLAVFAWREDLGSPARRKKAGVSFDDVYAALAASRTHDALAAVDFQPFEDAIAAELGRGDDAPYVLERRDRALMFWIGLAHVPHLVAKIGTIARRFGLTSVGER